MTKRGFHPKPEQSHSTYASSRTEQKTLTKLSPIKTVQAAASGQSEEASQDGDARLVKFPSASAVLCNHCSLD